MRSLLLALLLAAACGTAQATPAAPAAFDPVQFAIDHTYRVEVDCPGENDDSGGSAVDIGEGVFLTAKHVVDPLYVGCVVKLKNDTHQFVSDNVEWHPSADMAAVTVVTYDSPQVGFVAPSLGLDVVAVGYPSNATSDGQELGVTKGNVAGRPEKDGEVRFTAPIWRGNSGGGVWDYNGHLAGISVSMLLGRPSWFYLVPASSVNDLR